MTRLDELRPDVGVIFAKPPEPGNVKTRLIGRLEPAETARLYRAFLHDVADRLADFASRRDADMTPVLAYTGDPEHPSFEHFRKRDFAMIPQGDGNLGDKLQSVTERCFSHGARRLVVIGSDSPTLMDRHLARAYRALAQNDVVLGPSFDGGYYLVGLTNPAPRLFADIDWSTPDVLEQTVARCRELDLLPLLTEFWYDVDTFADLQRLRFHLLEYLSKRDQTVATRTAELLRDLDDRGVFDGECS